MLSVSVVPAFPCVGCGSYVFHVASSFVIGGRRYILSSVKRIGGNYISVDMRKVVLRPGFGVGLGRPCGCVAGLLGLAGDFTGLLVKHQRCLVTVGVAGNT